MPGKIVVKIDKDIADLVPVYLNSRRKNMEEIPGLLAKDDYEALRRMGHQMKGSGGGFGLALLTGLGGRIELAAQKKDKKAIQAQAAKLRDYLDSLEIVYVDME